ncbi:MAG: aspartate aminotransferase family protein [Bacteroidota bacterium]
MHISQRQLFFSHVAQTSPEPLALEIEKAEGSYLFGTDGKQYLDFISGISVSNVGHRHPKVIAAIQEQLNKHMHVMVYGEFIQSPQVKLATALSATMPGKLDSIYFVNSGTEATEGAIKLIKRATGRKKIIAFKNSYHGSTNGALSLMSDEYFSSAYLPLLPNIEFLNPNDESELHHIDKDTAGVFVELIRGECGAIPLEPSFVTKLKIQCEQVGALLVVDEIQSGFGRTGKFWACEHYELIPDVLLMAKGMGGGMPIGAFAASHSLMKELSHNPVLGHITTFGGHPVSCMSSLATLEIVNDIVMTNHVLQCEQLIRKELLHPKIKAIQGKGLLLSGELSTKEENFEFIKSCVKDGLITDWFLFADHRFRIAPPLTISQEELNHGLIILKSNLDRL